MLTSLALPPSTATAIRSQIATQGAAYLSSAHEVMTPTQWGFFEQDLAGLSYRLNNTPECGRMWSSTLYTTTRTNYLEEQDAPAVSRIIELFTTTGLPLVIEALGGGPLYLRAATALRYESGCCFYEHSDNQNNPYNHVAVIYLLNSDYQGGLFNVYAGENNEAMTSFQTARHSLIVIPGDTVHEVTMIRNGVRASAAFFLSAQDPRY